MLSRPCPAKSSVAAVASGHLERPEAAGHDSRVAGDAPVVYREEVLTIMGVLGDVRHELRKIRQVIEDGDEEEEEEEGS